ncbi:CopG family ribbon-helix-helix protein [Planktothrix pseudagardhii]|uniref:Ribbon-helix-helix protein CopG domain-containing protein n=1 Tax=Planktothrix pseudagardhii TaxID=132604 RepID=A0A9W4DDH6_9CYAN|nr:ribbon-helix-helix domain-containing protein [Planktothrix pseudagardhii]CAD5982041.1 hypothetical protein NO713_04924 [Planktothrix pseudagardhii]
MPTNSITIPVSETLSEQLKTLAELQDKSEHELIIEALESYIRKFIPEKSCYDLAIELDVIGSVVDLPTDLSTNPDYFNGFGGV